METKTKKFYTLRAIAAKTLILAASVLLFTQCSKNDDPDDKPGGTTSKNSIAPPAWIPGYWAETYVADGVTNIVSGARFTKNNLIVYAGSTMELDLVAMAKTDGITLSDEESGAKYTVTFQVGSVSNKYQYEKKSDTEIIYTAITNCRFKF
jgi:hypothetical protein